MHYSHHLKCLNFVSLEKGHVSFFLVAFPSLNMSCSLASWYLIAIAISSLQTTSSMRLTTSSSSTNQITSAPTSSCGRAGECAKDWMSEYKTQILISECQVRASYAPQLECENPTFLFFAGLLSSFSLLISPCAVHPPKAFLVGFYLHRSSFSKHSLAAIDCFICIE